MASDYKPENNPKYYEKPDLNHPLCRGLVGWWMLNDGGGNTAHDYLRMNHGTLYGPTWQGGALGFDGDDYVDIPVIFPLQTSAPFTICAWFQTTYSSGNHTIWHEGTTVYSHSYVGLHFRLSSSGTIWTGAYPGGTVSGTGNYNDGEWHHGCIVREADGNYIIYGDGRYENSGNPACNAYGLNGSQFGRWMNSSNPVEYFNGLIDDIRIYNRVLSEAEVGGLHENTLSGEYEEFPRLDVSYFYMPVSAEYRQRIIAIF